MTSKTAIGIDLGATNIKGVLVSGDGEILHEINHPIPIQEEMGKTEGAHWKSEVKNAIRTLKSETEDPITALGLAAPGVANSENDAIAHMPQRLQGLENFKWQEYVGEDRIWVVNDAHAALLGEMAFGVGKGYKNVVMLTLGTGVGGAICINGELYQGNHQIAGHLGHISVNSGGSLGITNIPGNLEDAIGNATISKRSYGRFNSVLELVKSYQAGETLGTYVWLNSVRDLAVGICSLANALSPELIILGGGISKAGPDLFGPLKEFMDVYEWAPGGNKVAIKQAKYTDFAGAIGAAAFGLSNNP